MAVENGSIAMVKCCTCTPKAYVGASCAGVGWYRSRLRLGSGSKHPAVLGGVGFLMRRHAYLVVGACGTGAGCMVGCVGGGYTRAGSGSGWPSRTVQSSISGLCWVSASAALIGAGSGGVWYRSRLKFRCRAAVEKGSKGVVCCHAPVLQLGPTLALVVEPKTYVVRGWDGTGAGSGSKRPAVTVWVVLGFWF